MDPISQRAYAPGGRALPTGTVTFLFTDIEGSTQRWEAKRDAMKAAVARHDALLRGAIETAGGYIFKTIGDAFCAAFRTAPEAIRAALDVQRTLVKEDFSAVDELRVRAALHTGYADERDGDYFGPTVNRVARLLSIGHGGQMLLSGPTADLAQGELPPQTSLRDLGAHRLKDLAHPEHVFQIVAADMPAEFPPLRSLDSLPNNLPLQVTSFVGRETDLDEVKRLVGLSLLITLVGADNVNFNRTFAGFGLDKDIARLSLLLEENTLLGIGPDSSNNLFSSMSYYANAPGEANKKFKAAYFAKFGDKAPQLGLIDADAPTPA